MDKINKVICNICLHQIQGDIVMLRDKIKLSHSNYNITYSTCDDCQEMIKESFVLIGIIGSKTTDKERPYRSGNIWGINKEDANNVFSHLPEILQLGVSYIDVFEAEKLKLPNINYNA